jgi:hypothetical protein
LEKRNAMSIPARIVSNFSCGAASAVATKLLLSEFGRERVFIVNAFVKEEHPDGRRFLADCEKWFDHPIVVVRDTKYGASAREVWRRKRFMNSALGAPCSMLLKRQVIDAVCQPGDVFAFGFTADAADVKRAQRFLDGGAICPLIDRNLTKADCLAMVERAGLVLPAMYQLGFANNNCIGCCKGGEGYWDFTRQVFPDDFIEVCEIQESIGPGAFMFRNRKTGERFSLRDLPVGVGRHDVAVPECSFFCAMAEEEIQ